MLFYSAKDNLTRISHETLVEIHENQLGVLENDIWLRRECLGAFSSLAIFPYIIVYIFDPFCTSISPFQQQNK